jgi:hypothetical protein
MALAYQMEVVQQSIDNNTNTMVVISLTIMAAFNSWKVFSAQGLLNQASPNQVHHLPSRLNIIPRL